MEGKSNFGELLSDFLNRKRQKEIARTGIQGYCICCGFPHYVDREREHDKECIWYNKEEDLHG